MITFRTKVLLFLAALCGLGIGALAPLSDGLYSAMLFFSFPFLVAFTALAIGIDLNKVAAAKKESRVRESPPRVRFVPYVPLVTSRKVN